MPSWSRRFRLDLHLHHLILHLRGRSLRRDSVDTSGFRERNDGLELACALPRSVLLLLLEHGLGEAVNSRYDKIAETACSPGVDVPEEEEDADDVCGFLEVPLVEGCVFRAVRLRLACPGIRSGSYSLWYPKISVRKYLWRNSGY